jgi:RsiW-degrading membrane proteinase PrsW (M82 family)
MGEKHPPQCVIPIHKPSIRELAFFFASGILLSIPFAAFFESLIPSIVSTAILVVVLAPLIEELAKVYPLFYRHGETERSLVNLGLLIGLGFGVAEFFEYVVLIDVPFYIRLPGIIFHASTAVITAYGIVRKNPLPYYLLAVFLHMANNFFSVESAITLGYAAELLVLVATYLLAWRFYHRTSPNKMIV